MAPQSCDNWGADGLWAGVRAPSRSQDKILAGSPHSSRLVQHRGKQPSCHLDRHRHPLPGVGHPGQRGLVCKEGKCGEVRRALAWWGWCSRPTGGLASPARAEAVMQREQVFPASAWQTPGLTHSACLALNSPPDHTGLWPGFHSHRHS